MRANCPLARGLSDTGTWCERNRTRFYNLLAMRVVRGLGNQSTCQFSCALLRDNTTQRKNKMSADEERNPYWFINLFTRSQQEDNSRLRTENLRLVSLVNRQDTIGQKLVNSFEETKGQLELLQMIIDYGARSDMVRAQNVNSAELELQELAPILRELNVENQNLSVQLHQARERVTQLEQQIAVDKVVQQVPASDKPLARGHLQNATQTQLKRGSMCKSSCLCRTSN